ncbi:MAG: glycosyltransferase family 2 protein [Cyclobacteriaceae bacterium]
MQITALKEVAGVVVLYNPDGNVTSNIDSYLHQVERLFVVDNSEFINKEIVSKVSSNKKVKYIGNRGNRGVAFALNKGIDAAIEEGFRWLLTMDQDTSLPEGAVETMYKFGAVSCADNVGLVSPKHIPEQKESKIDDFVQVSYTMTSGNLLNLDSVREVGGFIDDLFIDHVDHEFCFRLNRAGYKIFESDGIAIEHKLGEDINKAFLGYKVAVRGHSPFRLFYMVRNGLIVSKIYPEQVEFSKHVWVTILRELVKSVFLYEKKYESVKALFRGYQASRKDYKSIIRKVSGAC